MIHTSTRLEGAQVVGFRRERGMSSGRKAGLGNCVFYLVFVAHLERSCAEPTMYRGDAVTCMLVTCRFMSYSRRKYRLKSSKWQEFVESTVTVSRPEMILHGPGAWEGSQDLSCDTAVDLASVFADAGTRALNHSSLMYRQSQTGILKDGS